MFLSGGASNSIILPQLISDAICVKVKILDSNELGALGISYLISSYLNQCKVSDIINSKNKVAKTFTPNKKNSSYLNKKYLQYKKLRESLIKIW